MDGLDAEAENWRRAAGAGAEELWKAGTRKEGRVMTDEGESALAVLGASMIVAVLATTGCAALNHVSTW